MSAKHKHDPDMTSMIFAMCRKCGSGAGDQRRCKVCGKVFCVECQRRAEKQRGA